MNLIKIVNNVICENYKLTILFIIFMIFYIIIGTDQPKKKIEQKFLGVAQK
jgi:hypothetical protein